MDNTVAFRFTGTIADVDETVNGEPERFGADWLESANSRRSCAKTLKSRMTGVKVEQP